MNKPTLLYVSPIASRSGYGEHAREVARFLVSRLKDTHEINFSTVGWGKNPLTGLDDNSETTRELLSYISFLPSTQTPEVYVQMGLPSEFNPMGKYNIGITAGIETSRCSEDFINGCNGMDLVIVPSEFTKDTLLNSHYTHGDGMINKLTTPVEVIPQTLDIKVFGRDKEVHTPELDNQMDTIKEDFCFLFVGQWNPIQNNPGGRKNVATMITNFVETFSKHEIPPALVLKTHGTNFSHIDFEKIQSMVNRLTDTYSEKIPNIYLIHGELTQEELNALYNHEKVKCHLTYTRGEGFCRPLLEASASGKPIIASKWSGHLDFLPRGKTALLPGKLINPKIDNDMFAKGCEWFDVDPQKASDILNQVYSDYEKYLSRAIKLSDINIKKYNSTEIFNIYSQIFDTYIPQTITTELKLPTSTNLLDGNEETKETNSIDLQGSRE